ncbi:MAG: cytochrome c [Caldilineaceae bacterium]|nr:cytochrome c [Caldilineaceae bacterium]
MQQTQLSLDATHRGMRFVVLFGLLLVVALVIGACQPVSPAAPVAEQATPAATEEPVEAGDPANGEYIANLTGGCGCHFNSDLGGLAGGRKFEGPFGVVYSANLTSDEETGIAGLSDEVLISILRTGQEVEEDGEIEVMHPIMPYMTFSVMSDKDVRDLVAYLRTLPPLSNAVPERELASDPQPFTPAAAPPAESPTEPVVRGEYLVTLANCGGCHTPRNEDGSPNTDMLLAGGPIPDEIAANITPDEATGIGRWSEEEIANLLITGIKPNGDETAGAMAQQVRRRFSRLTEEDALAIAAYLKSIPAVSNDPYSN